MKRLVSAMVLTLGALVAGCAQGPIYGPDSRGSIGSVTERQKWTASGNIQNPSLACDGKVDTMAVGPAGNPPPSLTIDLGQACVFNFIVVDHGPDEFGFAHEVEIDVSMDGRNFTRKIVGLGTRRVTNFLLHTPVLARYIRLTAIQPGRKPWVVAEVYLQ